MLCAVDVSYGDGEAVAAAVLAAGWHDAEPLREVLARVSPVHSYRPGAFFLRELPCILAVLEHIDEVLDVVVVDGYVWLDGLGREGLGAHLFRALGEKVSVVGVAKTAFAGSHHAVQVLRGRSRRPLFVTAAGMEPLEAARCVAQMHGAHRLPTLLRRVDRLGRSHTFQEITAPPSAGNSGE